MYVRRCLKGYFVELQFFMWKRYISYIIVFSSVGRGMQGIFENVIFIKLAIKLDHNYTCLGVIPCVDNEQGYSYRYAYPALFYIRASDLDRKLKITSVDCNFSDHAFIQF